MDEEPGRGARAAPAGVVVVLDGLVVDLGVVLTVAPERASGQQTAVPGDRAEVARAERAEAVAVREAAPVESEVAQAAVEHPEEQTDPAPGAAEIRGRGAGALQQRALAVLAATWTAGVLVGVQTVHRHGWELLQLIGRVVLTVCRSRVVSRCENCLRSVVDGCAP